MKYPEDFFQSKYLAAADLKGREFTLTIARLEHEDLADSQSGEVVSKVVIYFLEAKKGFAINRTNGDCIAAMFGADTSQWISKRITLVPEEAQLGNQTVPAIRIKGSPDISAAIAVTIKLPRKRPQQRRLVITGGKATSS